jgi:hypothetical protein
LAFYDSKYLDFETRKIRNFLTLKSKLRIMANNIDQLVKIVIFMLYGVGSIHKETCSRKIGVLVQILLTLSSEHNLAFDL